MATDFQKSMVDKYKYTTYTKHFEGTFRFLAFASIGLISISALSVAKSVEGYLASTFGGMAIFAGVVVAAIVAYWTHTQTEKLLVYYHAQGMIEPVLGIKLAILLALVIYADYNGAPKWANEFVGEAPADIRTSELGGIYTPQISAIDKEIEEIESKHFYWCESHNAAHKCPSANFYIDPKLDKKHVAKINELKAQKSELQGTMNSLLGDAGAQYNSQLSEYNSELQSKQEGMRFGSLIATALFLLVSKWRHDYGTRYIKEAETPNTAEKTGHTAHTAKQKPYTAGKKLRAVYANKQSRVSRVKATQQPFSRAENLAKSVNAREEELARENMALKEEVARNEEINALREMEEAKRTSGKKI